MGILIQVGFGVWRGAKGCVLTLYESAMEKIASLLGGAKESV